MANNVVCDGAFFVRPDRVPLFPSLPCKSRGRFSLQDKTPSFPLPFPPPNIAGPGPLQACGQIFPCMLKFGGPSAREGLQGLAPFTAQGGLLPPFFWSSPPFPNQFHGFFLLTRRRPFPFLEEGFSSEIGSGVRRNEFFIPFPPPALSSVRRKYASFFPFFFFPIT